MDSKLKFMLNNMPSHWNKEVGSGIYTLSKAISDEFNEFNDQLSIIDRAIGIDGTYGSDLDNRWGKMLNIPRLIGESDDVYRHRLKLSVIKLYGGTDEAIRYAVAIELRIDNDQQAMDDMIGVYDSWDYTGHLENVGPGYAVCEITIPYDKYLSLPNISNTVRYVKASGIMVYIVYKIVNTIDVPYDTYISISHRIYQSMILDINSNVWSTATDGQNTYFNGALKFDGNALFTGNIGGKGANHRISEAIYNPIYHDVGSMDFMASPMFDGHHRFDGELSFGDTIKVEKHISVHDVGIYNTIQSETDNSVNQSVDTITECQMGKFDGGLSRTFNGECTFDGAYKLINTISIGG